MRPLTRVFFRPASISPEFFSSRFDPVFKNSSEQYNLEASDSVVFYKIQKEMVKFEKF
jgi:hypothetical protein